MCTWVKGREWTLDSESFKFVLVSLNWRRLKPTLKCGACLHHVSQEVNVNNQIFGFQK